MLSTESTTALVEILAVLRPNAVRKTVRALEGIEQTAFTRWRALGRGRQHGIVIDEGDATGQIEWLCKVVFSIVVPDDRREQVIAAIIEANQTPSVGDGMIFICPIEEEVSVRTGDRGAVAVEM